MKNKKWMTLYGLAIAGTLMLGASPAHASQIAFGGTITLTQDGNSANPAAGLAFTSLTVIGAGTDTLEGAPASITSSGSGFVMSGPITTSGTTSTANFSSPGGTFSIGNLTTGTLSGNVNFISISTNSASPGFFSVDVNLTGLTVTPGNSALIQSAANSNNGAGSISFNFSSGPQTLSQLESIGLLGDGYQSPLIDSVAGTLTTVPEPASLALFGSGLLGLAFLFKRRLFEGSGLDLQS